jgi:hypothetical protein
MRIQIELEIDERGDAAFGQLQIGDQAPQAVMVRAYEIRGIIASAVARQVRREIMRQLPRPHKGCGDPKCTDENCGYRFRDSAGD